MKRGKPLARSGCTLKRKPMRRVSQKRLEQQGDLEAFRAALLKRAGGRCERCGSSSHLHAHHLVSRARARGKPWVHDPERNGACLCAPCHQLVHEAAVSDWREWCRREPRPISG